MPRKTLVLRAVGPARPRWWGDFTPTARGPVIHAEATPLPLPSTVVGAIASAFNVQVKTCLQKLSENPLACQEEALKILGVDGVGPITLAVCDKAGCKPLMPVAIETGRNAFIDLEGNTYEVELGVRMGVGLQRDKKAAMEGLLYSEELAWTIRGSNGSTYPYTVAVELETKRSLGQSGIVYLGGERTVFQVEVSDKPILETQLKKLWGASWEKPVKNLVVAVLTPLILELDHVDKVVLKPYEVVVEALKKRLGLRNLEPLTRCRIAGLGLGYDVAVNLPRPYKPVLLPGCFFEAELEHPTQPSRIYRYGLGSQPYHSLGWSQILPLPVGFENKVKRAT